MRRDSLVLDHRSDIYTALEDAIFVLQPVVTADDPGGSPRRGRGRPRDPSVEAIVRAAVRESLIEDGFEATTIPAVARRAGIGAPTIYRRWPTQIELVEALFEDVFPGELLEVPPDEGDFVYVVREVVAGAFQFFGHPAARRAVPGLLAAYNGDPARYKVLTERIEVPSAKSISQSACQRSEAGESGEEARSGRTLQHNHRIRPPFCRRPGSNGIEDGTRCGGRYRQVQPPLNLVT